MSPRVCLDTNVAVSAVLTSGAPREIINLALSEKVVLFSSPALIEELSRVLLEKLNYPPLEVKKVVEQYEDLVVIAYPKNSVRKIKEDPSDNRVLEAAVEGKARFVVSGDKHLIKLKSYRGIKILKPKDFLENIEV